MPKPSSTAPGDRPQPVPVGLFLAHAVQPETPRAGQSAVTAPDWNGLPAATLAYLIRRYTRFGDVVVDLDGHPSVFAAARYLRRAPARLVTSRHGPRVRLVPPPAGRWPRRVVRRPGPGANLILVTLPRAGAYSLDLHGMTRAMNAWRPLLRPSGFLVAALTAHGSQPGTVSHRSTVIAAARAAGLRYHQHLPFVRVPLPEHEPRTEPERPDEADDGRRLLDGRHVPTFRDLLVFASTATGQETTHA
jgi:hypothetical protein